MPPRPPIDEMNLFFFDSETGGLNPATTDMIDVAVILTDPTGKTVLDEYNTKVKPVRPVEPGAAAVNGYTQEKWASAISLDEAMFRLLKMARNARFVAHNAAFDWGYVEMALAKRMMRWPGDYHRICTMMLAEPLLHAKIVPNAKLVTLSSYFGVPHEDAHTALADARACRGVYLKLMEIYAPLFSQQRPLGTE